MDYKYAPTLSPARANDDDFDGGDRGGLRLLSIANKPYKHYEQTFTAQHIHFYLSEEIGDPSSYTDMIHRITIAGPNDTVFIHLNTPGGHLDTGVQIINAMQNSNAKIVTVLDGTVYSLGTLIFLAGDEMVVNDHCMIMFHNFKGGVIGKGNELISQLEATVKWFSSLCKKVYIPFLTEAEFTQITQGVDLWMHSPEIRQRLNNMIKIQTEKLAKRTADKDQATPKPAAKKRGRPAAKTKVANPE